MWVVVRQLRPGLRQRFAYFRDEAVPIPDVEPVIHALFDLISRGAEGEAITTHAIADLAMKYARVCHA
jgi:hypothetical protein